MQECMRTNKTAHEWCEACTLSGGLSIRSQTHSCRNSNVYVSIAHQSSRSVEALNKPYVCSAGKQAAQDNSTRAMIH